MSDKLGKNQGEYYGTESFDRRHLGMFKKPSEHFKKAYQTWLSYFDQLEQYSQTVCKSRSPKGIAVAVTTEEMRLVNQKSRLLRQELFEPLVGLNISTEVTNEARYLALREHERRWARK